MPRDDLGAAMAAVVCDEPGRLRLTERAAPEAAPEGWVPVDVARVGICGTDFHIFEGKHPFLAYPRVMGHELSGRVAAEGHGFAHGELVIVNPYIACGECRACRRGKPNCCVRIEVLGVHRDGGLCERINVPASNLYGAEGLTPEQAAMVEFLAIGAHAVRRSAIGPGDRALVTGVGPIGLGVALFARLRGAEVHLLDASPERLAAARDRFGFESGVALAEGPEAVMARSGGEGFDRVFDATGVATAMEAGFAYVAHGGNYVLVSVVKDAITFADSEFHKREMSLIGSRNATREDFETVVQALRSGAIDHGRLHTHSATLAELPERLEAWTRDRAGLIKALVEVAP